MSSILHSSPYQHDLEEMHTIRDVLRYTISTMERAKIFFGHGIDNSFDEAMYLIFHTLRLPSERVEPFLDSRLTKKELKELALVLEQRISKRIPAAYITKEAWLGEFHFYIDERVIIPRSYIAEWLRDYSPWIQDSSTIHHALDLCTGSGCLAIILAHVFPTAEIDAVDLSTDALAVAQHNIAEYQLEDRINLICSDLFQKLSPQKYDLIISNPPYVTSAAMADLPAEYRAEPPMALAAGPDGLSIIAKILKYAGNHLTEQGLLVVEVGHNQELVVNAFPRLPFIWLDTPSSSGKIFLLSAQDLRLHHNH